MRIMKVFVLTYAHFKGEGELESDVIGVYSTKTRAKEEMNERKAYCLDQLREEDENVSVSTYQDSPSFWGVNVNEECEWIEMSITEHVVDKEN